MSIGMNESKEFNPLKGLIPNVKPKKKCKYFFTSLNYLLTYLHSPTYLLTNLVQPTYLPTYIVLPIYLPTYLNIDLKLF
jgi:hypothetical protein